MSSGVVTKSVGRFLATGLAIILGLAQGPILFSQAQSTSNSIFLPVIHQAPSRFTGSILAVHTLPDEPSFVAVTYGLLGGEIGEVLVSVAMSTNGGGDWIRPANRPWEFTGLLSSSAQYRFFKTSSGITTLALVYGHSTIENKSIADLYVSSDLGMSWTRRPVPVPALCQDRYIRAEVHIQKSSTLNLVSRIFCFVPVLEAPPVMFSFAGLSMDIGQTWVPLPNQPTENAFIVPTPAAGSRYFRFGFANEISISDDGGANWLAIGVPPPGGPNLSAVDSNRLVIAEYGRVHFSDDAGQTWEEWGNLGCFPAHSTYNFTEVSAARPIGYLMCADGRIVMTTDDGKTWAPVATLPIRLRANFDVFPDLSRPGRLLAFENGVGNTLWVVDSATGAVDNLLEMLPRE